MMKSTFGYSLAELITSLLMVSVGLLAVSTVALHGFHEFQWTKARLETELESLRLQYFLTAFFSQAVKVNMNNPTASGGGSWGSVLQFNYNRMSTSPRPLQLIAKFHREAGGRGTLVNEVIGTYQPSSIWWARPTPVTSGVVVFDYGDIDLNPMRATFGDQYVSRLTELQFTREPPSPGDPRLAAISVRAVFRFFHPSGGQRWCPTADITAGVANCVVGLRAKDFERSFRIVLRNNVIQDVSPTGTPIEERPLGLLYFFNPVIPQRQR